tara:strand:+ start:1150 stop:1860 length:711 start_codon:yes stop_codon:yes gene_type:complete
MATTNATLTLSSGDLVGSNLSLSASTVLNKAGNNTGMDQAVGLSRKQTSSLDTYTLFKADEFTANLAHKVYLKNISTTASEYFTVTIDDSILGRLYAGDWAFFPWAAADGVKSAFTVTFAATWAENDTAVFDGVTITLGSTETTAAMVDLVVAAKYPNFTVVETSASVATFTAKDSNDLSLIEEGVASDDYVVTTAGNGTGTVARTIAPVASASDIKITPSVGTAMTLESMLIFQA